MDKLFSRIGKNPLSPDLSSIVSMKFERIIYGQTFRKLSSSSMHFHLKKEVFKSITGARNEGLAQTR